MKIIQISSFKDDSGDARIFGLGDDQQMYEWSWRNGVWEIHKK